MRLTKNFTQWEFRSRDGAPMPADVLDNVRELACNLQVLRDFLGEPIKINTAYRSLKHNRSIGSKDSSQHIKGKAADIKVRDLDTEDLYLIMEKLIEIGDLKEGGLGLYNTFVHYDIRGTKARWDNRTKENFY